MTRLAPPSPHARLALILPFLLGVSFSVAVSAAAAAAAAAAPSDGEGNPRDGVVTMPMINRRTLLERRRRALSEDGIEMTVEELEEELNREEEEMRRRIQRRRRTSEKTTTTTATAAAKEKAYSEKKETKDDRKDDHDGDDVALPPPLTPQVGPLFQGYGTHYVDVWVGTPPQRQTVIVDTGSGVTAFPCGECDKCGRGFHSDDPFEETESSTFVKIKGAGGKCSDCELGRCYETACKISMAYQEGSSWTAYEAEDVAYAGGKHREALSAEPERKQTEGGGTTTTAEIFDGADPNSAVRYRFPLRFGCQTKLTGLFKTQLADGIMGMENGKSSFWSQMFSRGNGAMGREMFALCFSRSEDAAREGTSAGAFTLGGYDERLHQTPVVFAENLSRKGWYHVYVQNMFLRKGGVAEEDEDDDEDEEGGAKTVELARIELEDILINEGGVIVDSGTTDSYLSSHLAQPFKDAWIAVTGYEPPKNRVSVMLTEKELDALPTVMIQLKGASVELETDPVSSEGLDPAHSPGLAGAVDPRNPFDVIVEVPPRHYMERRGDRSYTFHLHFTENGGGVLGANVMRGHDVVFDMENSRVGFARSECDYGELAEKARAEEEK